MVYIGETAIPRLAECSWYASGKVTASGEPYDMDKYTAAHRYLPFGTLVALRCNERQIVVRINDRGPFFEGREFDLSRQAFMSLMSLHVGVATFEVVAFKLPSGPIND